MRIFLYSKEAPHGRIFTDQAEFAKALSDGWVDAPWLVGVTTPQPPAPKDEISLDLGVGSDAVATEVFAADEPPKKKTTNWVRKPIGKKG